MKQHSEIEMQPTEEDSLSKMIKNLKVELPAVQDLKIDFPPFKMPEFDFDGLSLTANPDNRPAATIQTFVIEKQLNPNDLLIQRSFITTMNQRKDYLLKVEELSQEEQIAFKK